MGTVEVEIRGALAILTLCNPTKRNALDPAMLSSLVQHVAELPKQGVRAAVLTGDGDRAFSSGYDIGALTEASLGGDPMAEVIAAISGGDLPIVAALNGIAVGGGCELASACDLRVAHPGVTLRMPPVRLGIVYPSRGLQRFVALIGMSRTRELFLTAAPVDAERALGWGLIDRVVPADQVLATALDLAGQIALGAPLAVRATRRVLEGFITVAESAQTKADARLAWDSEDAAEARLAFVEKRPPRFQGR